MNLKRRNCPAKGIFVTGTDTGVGKTVVCGLLARFLIEQGYKVITQKWIQTGGRSSCDINLHLKLMKKKRKDLEDYLPYLSSYAFEFPSSPHLAAHRENRRIRTDKIKKSFKLLAEEFDFVIVEGVGGALVSLNRKRLLIDLAKELKLSVLIVAANLLGAINHTLLTIEAIKKRKMKIVGVVFNCQPAKTNDLILKDNPRIIAELSGQKALGVLPWVKDKGLLYRKFRVIGKKVIAQLSQR